MPIAAPRPACARQRAALEPLDRLHSNLAAVEDRISAVFMKPITRPDLHPEAAEPATPAPPTARVGGDGDWPAQVLDRIFPPAQHPNHVPWKRVNGPGSLLAMPSAESARSGVTRYARRTCRVLRRSRRGPRCGPVPAENIFIPDAQK